MKVKLPKPSALEIALQVGRFLVWGSSFCPKTMLLLQERPLKKVASRENDRAGHSMAFFFLHGPRAMSQHFRLPSQTAFYSIGATRKQVQGAYFDFAGQWTRSHTFKSSTDVVTDSVLRDFKSFVYKRQKEVCAGDYSLGFVRPEGSAHGRPKVPKVTRLFVHGRAHVDGLKLLLSRRQDGLSPDGCFVYARF